MKWLRRGTPRVYQSYLPPFPWLLLHLHLSHHRRRRRRRRRHPLLSLYMGDSPEQDLRNVLVNFFNTIHF